MKKIEFLACYGDKIKTVEIAQALGAGDSYQILIDRYYHGTIIKQRGEWVAHLNSRSNLTADDILIIGDLIDQ